MPVVYAQDPALYLCRTADIPDEVRSHWKFAQMTEHPNKPLIHFRPKVSGSGNPLSKSAMWAYLWQEWQKDTRYVKGENPWRKAHTANYWVYYQWIPL